MRGGREREREGGEVKITVTQTHRPFCREDSFREGDRAEGMNDSLCNEEMNEFALYCSIVDMCDVRTSTVN